MTFVTLVNEKFVPGLYALLESLRQNAKLGYRNHFIIIYLDDGVLRHKSKLSKFGFEIDWISAKTLGKITAPLKQKRYQEALQKLLIFNLPYNKTLCFIDSDMICLKPLKQLKKMTPMKAVRNIGNKLEIPIHGQPMFNTGLLIFQPSGERFKKILSYIEQSDFNFELGDQGVLNRYIYSQEPDRMELLDLEWNMPCKVKHLHPKVWKKTRIRLLHYVSKKPWLTPFWDPKLWSILSLNLLWWKFYLRAVLHAFFSKTDSNPVHEQIEEFFRNNPNPSVIQVGAHDGLASDPLREFLIRYKPRAILVEPVTNVFRRLERQLFSLPLHLRKYRFSVRIW